MVLYHNNHVWRCWERLISHFHPSKLGLIILIVWIILLLYMSWCQWSLGFFFQLKSIHVFTGEGFLFLSTNVLNERITINMIVFELVLILMTRPLIKSFSSVLQLPHPVGTHKRAIQLPTVWPLHPRPGGDDRSHWRPAQEPRWQSEWWSWYDSLLQNFNYNPFNELSTLSLCISMG